MRNNGDLVVFATQTRIGRKLAAAVQTLRSGGSRESGARDPAALPRSMPVPVMSVREMRMNVRQRFVPVPVSMPVTGRRDARMLMPMMFIVDMLVLVPLGQMQPQAQCHERACHG